MAGPKALLWHSRIQLRNSSEIQLRDSYLFLLPWLTLGTAQPFWEKQLHIPDSHWVGSGA